MMGKGKGGTGKNWTSWPRRHPGTRAYLKNYRKGLHHQRGQAWRAMEAALDDAKNVAQGRYYWVLEKQGELDNDHVMVFEPPDMQEGGQMRFADLKNTA